MLCAGLPAPVPLAIMPPPGSEGASAAQGEASGSPPQGAAASQGFASGPQGLGGLPVGSLYPMQPGMYQQFLGAAAGGSPPMAPG